MIPGPWVALVLVLATFRICRLAGWDHFPPLLAARRWATGEYVVSSGSTNARLRVTNEEVEYEVRHRRPTLYAGLSCAYCSSVWFGAAVYLAWRLEPSWTLTGAAVLAASAAVGLVARWLDP